MSKEEGRPPLRRNPVARAARFLARFSWFNRLSRTIRWQPIVDRLGHRLSGGRIMPSRLVVPTVMLVHTGRTSGRTIRTPIGAIELCDGWVIGDGNYGRARRPDWSRNLRANPMAVVETRAGV